MSLLARNCCTSLWRLWEYSLSIVDLCFEKLLQTERERERVRERVRVGCGSEIGALVNCPTNSAAKQVI